MALTATHPNRHTAARQRYVSDNVQTLTPAKLLTMLYDKLVSELERGEIALAADDAFTSNDALVRCQAIVLELRSSLRMDVWDGAAGLAALYDFFTRELIAANIGHEPDRVRAVRVLVEPLRDAWHQAAAALAGAS